MSECTICLESFAVPSAHENPNNSRNYQASGRVLATPCGHLFHIVCLDRWMQGKPVISCPQCKFNFRRSTAIQLYVDWHEASQSVTSESLRDSNNSMIDDLKISLTSLKAELRLKDEHLAKAKDCFKSNHELQFQLNELKRLNEKQARTLKNTEERFSIGLGQYNELKKAYDESERKLHFNTANNNELLERIKKLEQHTIKLKKQVAHFQDLDHIAQVDPDNLDLPAVVHKFIESSEREKLSIFYTLRTKFEKATQYSKKLEAKLQKQSIYNNAAGDTLEDLQRDYDRMQRIVQSHQSPGTSLKDLARPGPISHKNILSPLSRKTQKTGPSSSNEPILNEDQLQRINGSVSTLQSFETAQSTLRPELSATAASSDSLNIRVRRDRVVVDLTNEQNGTGFSQTEQSLNGPRSSTTNPIRLSTPDASLLHESSGPPTSLTHSFNQMNLNKNPSFKQVNNSGHNRAKKAAPYSRVSNIPIASNQPKQITSDRHGFYM